MWLSIIAYAIRIGVKLGVVQTEPASAESRAYVRAHDAIHWLRSHLVGCRVESVQPTSVCFWQGGARKDISLKGTQLILDDLSQTSAPERPLMFDPKGVQEFELGPQGYARFDYAQGGLNMVVEVGDDTTGTLGHHRSEIRFLVPLQDST